MNYKNGKIYKILNTVSDDVYYGSTTRPLCSRMSKHRFLAKNKDYVKSALYDKMNEIGIEKFYIELVKEYPCENIEQLNRREGEYIRQNSTLNHQIAGRTQKEKNDDTKDYRKNWYIEHKEEIRERESIPRR